MPRHVFAVGRHGPAPRLPGLRLRARAEANNEAQWPDAKAGVATETRCLVSVSHQAGNHAVTGNLPGRRAPAVDPLELVAAKARVGGPRRPRRIVLRGDVGHSAVGPPCLPLASKISARKAAPAGVAASGQVKDAEMVGPRPGAERGATCRMASAMSSAEVGLPVLVGDDAQARRGRAPGAAWCATKFAPNGL